MNPKYTAAEIERRWLVELAKVGSLAKIPSRKIEDRYLRKTRLRLRKISSSTGAVTYKLGKKYGKSELGESVVSIYLTEAEYQVLEVFEGSSVVKTRYSLHGGSLDVYGTPKLAFAVFEIEFTSLHEASSYSPPSFAGNEVTSDENYSGFALAAGTA